MAAKRVAETAAPASAEQKPVKADNRVIRVLTSGFNPKRGKSRLRFGLYRDGMTVSQYVEAGGFKADIPWDTKRKFIRLDPARESK